VERASGTGKIDMIDVSSGLADPIGHSYEDPAFIGDLHELIYRRAPAGEGSRSYLIPHQVSAELFDLHGKRVRYFQLKPH
jgi:hypothetical protein